MKLFLTSALLLLVVHSSLAAPWYEKVQDYLGFGEEGDDTPDFCGSYQCPRYTVVQSFDGYELRNYQPSVWVTAEIDGMESDYWEERSSMRDTFRKLFRYISGKNDKEAKIEMTVPVLSTHQKGKVVMGFMLPQEFADNPPQPTESGVSLYNAPQGQFYVKSFGGWGYGFFKNYFKDNLKELTDALDQSGADYNADMFFTAGYDSPWKLFNRHNEVWVPKK